MAGKGGRKKELDPEELARRKFRAKCRFRAIGRLVMENARWLGEEAAPEEDEADADDALRVVARAVRKRRKGTKLLQLNDKALLNKPAQDRTSEERYYLYKIIGDLKCFRRYPAHVKRKLAAVTYFKHYGPGRVIVRQNQEAHALYFIVAGEVAVTQTIYDELAGERVQIDIGVMRPGDMFGEVSLLHNINRTATCITNTVCELLVLMKNDFKNVLLDSVQKQWDEVNDAMGKFTYFDALDEVSQREGCIIAKMKSFAEQETIMGDGRGVPNFVYFVLSGTCQMIEDMPVIVTKRLGRSFYKLYKPKETSKPVVNESQDLELKYFKNIKTEQRKHSSTSDQMSLQQLDSKPAKSGILKRTSSGSDNGNILVTANSKKPIKSLVMFDEMKLPINVKTVFMQVCLMNAGCCFGFGENMKNRRVIAVTEVDCMLLPKIWLMQKNTANIWSRIKHFLDKKIPSTEKLFKSFVMDRRWAEYKDDVLEDVIARKNVVNWTTIHDVPYSIRIEEQIDY